MMFSDPLRTGLFDPEDPCVVFILTILRVRLRYPIERQQVT
jgi:hypothetical protein